MLTLWYTVKAWLAIQANSAAVRKRGMISQQRQLDKRISEERKWLHLTVAIIAAFMISVVPVFFFYLASLIGLRQNCYFYTVFPDEFMYGHKTARSMFPSGLRLW